MPRQHFFFGRRRFRARFCNSNLHRSFPDVILKRSLPRNSKLTALTIFALPLPVITALVSLHCHGAGSPNTGFANPTAASESTGSGASVAGGQTITSFII